MWNLFLRTEGIFSCSKFVLRLKVDPHLGGGADIPSQPHRSIHRDTTLALDDATDPIRGHSEG